MMRAVKCHCETLASVATTNSIRDVTTLIFAVSCIFHTRLCARDVEHETSHICGVTYDNALIMNEDKIPNKSTDDFDMFS